MVNPIRKKRELRRRARQSFETVSRPIRSASLFYSLYWLTEIRNEVQAGFDFMQIRTELYKAFQVYGIYTVARELLHAGRQLKVDGAELQSVDLDRGALESIISENLESVDAAYAAQILESIEPPPETGWYSNASRGSFEGFTSLVQNAEVEWGAFSQPKLFLRTARALFNLEDVPPSALKWNSAYGGRAWGGICSHLLACDDYGEVAWVNQSWSIQHNNSVWLDKIAIDVDDQEIPHRVYNRLHPNDKISVMTEDRMITPVLQDLLDERKQGNMEPVFAYAWEYQNEVDANLRRLSRRHGIDRTAVEEWVAPLELAMGTQEAKAVAEALDTLETLDLFLPGELFIDYMTEADPLLSSGQMNNDLPGLEDRVMERVREEGNFGKVELSKPKARILVDALEDYVALMTEPENVRFKVKLDHDPPVADVRHVEGVAGRLKKKL